MSAARFGAMMARLGGLVLALVAAAAIWGAPAHADGTDTNSCPPVPSPTDHCRTWIWPDGRQP